MQKEAAALKAGKKEMAEMVIAYGSVGLAYRVAALDAQTPKESALNCPPQNAQERLEIGQHWRPERDSSEAQTHCLIARLFSQKKQ